ncbi:MAG: cyclic nucleotide-binding domain-containing protein [Anaerolineae bacterium]|jgi:signal transduction histidine kinase
MDGIPNPDSSELDVKEFLRSIFFGLAEENLDELARMADTRIFPPGAVICEEGEPGNAFFIIVSGRVEIFKRLDEESKRALHESGSGEFFGEMAIVQEGIRTATVRAVETTTLLEIGREPFLRELGRSPSLAIRILTQLTSRLRDADQRAIVELRRANEELRRALQHLERLDRTKSDFIRVSAHELRTPVAALMGYAQMMGNHPQVQENSQLRTLVEGTVTSTERLHRIFNSILDLSRVMGEGLEIHRSPVSIPVVFQGIHLEFSEALRRRDLDLEMEGLAELPFCPGDPELLYKAFRHLVNNAIKYTPDGGRITVRGRRANLADLGPCVEVTVEDTGIGIAPDELDLVFEKFYRTGEVVLHSSGTTDFKGGGPGLGLAIARGIVAAHGGRVSAESPGYDEESCPGSRFIVHLRLEEGDPSAVAARSA